MKKLGMKKKEKQKEGEMGDTYLGICKKCGEDTDLIYGLCEDCARGEE